MNVRIPLLLAGLIALPGCVALPGGAPTFANAPGQSSAQAGVYTNETYELRMAFANPEGWRLSQGPEVATSCPPPYAIFCASNPSRLLTVVLMLEDGGLPMTNDDYHTLVRRGLREEHGEKLEHESIEQTKLTGQDSVVWTYTLTGDTIVQAYFRRGSQNFRLILMTPEDAFPRRRAEILGLVRAFKLLSPPNKA